MQFEITVKRKDKGTTVLVKEDDLEKVFTPYACKMILEAYAESMEDNND